MSTLQYLDRGSWRIDSLLPILVAVALVSLISLIKHWIFAVEPQRQPVQRQLELTSGLSLDATKFWRIANRV